MEVTHLFKILNAGMLCLLCACTNAPPPAYSVCSTQPGTLACQVERYDHVD